MKSLKYYILLTISAAIAVIMFFHINSYVADKYSANWLFWLAGFVFSGTAVYYLIQTRNNSNG